MSAGRSAIDKKSETNAPKVTDKKIEDVCGDSNIFGVLEALSVGGLISHYLLR